MIGPGSGVRVASLNGHDVVKKIALEITMLVSRCALSEKLLFVWLA